MDHAKINTSSSSAFIQMMQAKTENSQSQSPVKPFNQQFDYHLADVPIQRKKKAFVPDGVLLIFFPGLREFEVYFRKRETIEELRKSIEEKIKFSTEKYYVVSKRGIIGKGMTLDDYGVSDGDNLVLIEKGVSQAKQIQNRDQWIENRTKRLENPATAVAFPLHSVQKVKPTPVKKRKLQKQTSLEAIEELLKTVKLEEVL